MDTKQHNTWDGEEQKYPRGLYLCYLDYTKEHTVQWGEEAKEAIDIKFNGESFDYFNIERHEYYVVLTPVMDVCDMGTDFIHVNDLWDTYYKNNSFYMNQEVRGMTWGDVKEYIVFDLSKMCEKMVKYVKDYKGRKRWHRLYDIFGEDDIPKERYNRRHDNLPYFGSNCPLSKEYVVERREVNLDGYGYRNDWYISKAKNVKPRKYEEGYVAPKRKIYKCGMTRTELREEWTSVRYCVNRALENLGIPLSITSKNLEDIPVAIKACKNAGLTLEVYKQHIWGKDEDSNAVKMFKNPNKYKWEPSKK